VDVRIHDILTRNARLEPDRLAATLGDETRTFGELDLLANRAAHRLTAAGVAHRDRVVWWGPTDLAALEVCYGVTRAGGALAPVNPAFGEQEAAAALTELRPRLVVAHPDCEDAARAVAQNLESGSNPIIGIPTVLRYQRTVGGELDSTRRATILSVIRRVMGLHGEASEVSGSLEWRTKGGSVERLVSVSSGGGRTTIEGSTNLRSATVGTYISGGLIATAITFLGISASVGGPSLSIVGLILSIGFLAAACLGLRAIQRKRVNSEAAKLERVVYELAQLPHGPRADSPFPTE